MRVQIWLNEAIKKLKLADIPTARLDALVLLEDAAGKDRSWLLAHPEYEIDINTEKTLTSQITRRAKHEPLAYIRGKSEFYGREFKVTAATLQPRSETETMITLFKGLKLNKDKLIVADIGTGSGCIAITVKLEKPNTEVHAIEINKEALAVTQENAAKLGADVKFHFGSLLEPLTAIPDVLLCNLPYVPDSHTINKAAMQEPKIAIFGGEDGLDLYRELFERINSASKPEYILTESLPFQHDTLARIAGENGYELKESEDFIQIFQLT